MDEAISSRQRQILKLLLENKDGLNIDEIAKALAISRNAVQQHFAGLERDGYIQQGALNKTAGRPVRTFVLSEAGINSFPKKYAWFSELVLTDLKEELGAEAFQRYLHRLGDSLAKSLLYQFDGKNADDRIKELLAVMNDLGFQAKATEVAAAGSRAIEACNCIYHDLAQKNDEICEFDRALISSLLGRAIEHTHCMAKGACVCRFVVENGRQGDQPDG